MTALDLHLNHMAPGPVIRTRLIESLDFPLVGDRSELEALIYLANDPNAAPLPQQSAYVAFGGEYPGEEEKQGRGLDHIWLLWILQRIDYPGWEEEYGKLRASIVCTLDGWQPGEDVSDLGLVQNACDIQQFPGLISDRLAFRLSQINFGY